jgi:hypothetical protein
MIRRRRNRGIECVRIDGVADERGYRPARQARSWRNQSEGDICVRAPVQPAIVQRRLLRFKRSREHDVAARRHADDALARQSGAAQGRPGIAAVVAVENAGALPTMAEKKRLKGADGSDGSIRGQPDPGDQCLVGCIGGIEAEARYGERGLFVRQRGPAGSCIMRDPDTSVRGAEI